ncbi:MAG: PIN domain-containing protein [Chitinophagaceae bacterium]
MRIFVDANIIISVLNKEYPSFTYTSRILSLGSFKNFVLYTSPICLAIAFYFAEKKHTAAKAKDKIRLLCEHIHITDTGESVVKNALKNNKILDFEDGLEYYSAIESKCNCIVTEDVDDFYFAEMEIINSENFFDKYMVRK